MTLPSGWAQCEVADIAANEYDAITDGPFGSSLKSDHYTNAGIRVVRLGNIGSRRFISDDEAFVDESRLPELRRHEACAGDLVTAALGEPLGRTAPIPPTYGPAIVKADCFRLRPSARVEKELILYWLNSPTVLRSFLDRSKGIGRVRINLGTFRTTTLPIPPLAEQRRIVAKLDTLTVRISYAREELARSHKLVASLKREALATADNGDRTGRIAPWLAAPIRNGLSVKGSDMPPGIRALRLGALRADVVDLDVVRHLPISVARAEPFLLKADDILVSRGNGTLALVGRASRVPSSLNTTSTIFPDTAFRLRFDPAQVDVTWLLHVWNSPLVRQQIESRARTTAGIWKISQVDLNEITFPKLPLAEQRAAASRISAILARADRLEAEAARAATLLDRLEASILAKAFRGELVPQDLADEPASILLDRIRTDRAAAPRANRDRRVVSAASS